MKKKNLILSALLFFSILPMTLFSACDKDTNCYLDVSVVDEATKNPISMVEVEVFQDRGRVHDKGITGSDGVYSTHFTAPAIVKIKAVYQLYDSNNNPAGQRRGETSVRLLEGETVEVTIPLTAQVYY